MTSTIAHIVTYGSGRSGTENIHQGISDLTEMTSSHRFAARARDILHFLAAYWGVEVEWKDVDGRNPLALCRPQSTSSNYFCPNVGNVDMKSSFRTGTMAHGGEEDNPMFWPFPMQGRPFLGLGEELRRAGFEVLGQVTEVFHDRMMHGGVVGLEG